MNPEEGKEYVYPDIVVHHRIEARCGWSRAGLRRGRFGQIRTVRVDRAESGSRGFAVRRYLAPPANIGALGADEGAGAGIPAPKDLSEGAQRVLALSV